MISYVTELVKSFEKYKNGMFGPALKDYQKGPDMDNTVLISDKIYITGDMPDTTASGDIMNPDKNLCAIISFYELSSSSVWAQYGEISAVTRTPISLSLWTADPILREEIHVCMTGYLLVNGSVLISGRTKTGVNWELDTAQSLGFGGSPEGLYNRMYTLWMKSIWVPY